MDGGGAHEDAYGGKELFLRDTHRGRHVDHEGWCEVVAFWEFRVVVVLAADEAAGALSDGVSDEVFKAGEATLGYHGADVGFWIIKGGAWAKCADAGFEDTYKRGIRVWKSDDAFNANAVLAGGLEDPTHENTSNLAFEVFRVVKNNSWVFAA